MQQKSENEKIANFYDALISGFTVYKFHYLEFTKWIRGLRLQDTMFKR